MVRVAEHPLQKQIADALRFEIAPAGKVSRDGVVWWSVDHANYAGTTPGVRCRQGADRRHSRSVCAAPWRRPHDRDQYTECVLSDAQRAGSACDHVGVVRSTEEALACLDTWGFPGRGVCVWTLC